jgi:hypothetical protein
MPVNLDVKVVVDEKGTTRITFNKKALMEASLAQLIRDTSAASQSPELDLPEGDSRSKR